MGALRAALKVSSTATFYFFFFYGLTSHLSLEHISLYSAGCVACILIVFDVASYLPNWLVLLS